jgi:uncharacterized UBP type Zn finger protein
MEKCIDMAAITELKQPKEYKCAICAQHGGSWVHLRTCQTCGITLCCDSSPQKHATKHFQETRHPVIISAEPDEQWMWCYKHELFTGYE